MNSHHGAAGKLAAHGGRRSAVSQTRPDGTEAPDAPEFGVMQLARLHEAGTACALDGTEAGLLDTLLELVLEVTDSDFGTVHLLESGSQRLHVVAHRGLSAELVDACESEGDAQAMCQAAIDSRRRIVDVDVRTSPSLAEGVRQALLRMEAVALAAVPFCAGDGDPLGVVSAYSRRPARPADRRLHLVDLLLRHAADFVVLARSRHTMSMRCTAERKARRRAEEASRSKDEFLAMVSHELRQPLSAVFPAFAVYQRSSSPERRQRAADVIRQQLQQMGRLVEDFADAAYVSRGVVQLRREPVALRALIRQVLETMRPVFESKQQQVTIDIGSDPAWISVDPARMHQVFSNLLQNAAAYTPPGGEVGVALVSDGATLRIHVRDTGIGIPSEALGRVFQLFERGSQHNAASSFGIGLAVVRQIVELHGGSVSVSSAEGQGTDFLVTLPVTGESQSARSA
jgi:signal transduction histidine kinase